METARVVVSEELFTSIQMEFYAFEVVLTSAVTSGNIDFFTLCLFLKKV